jgi:hypothetical protein
MASTGYQCWTWTLFTNSPKGDSIDESIFQSDAILKGGTKSRIIQYLCYQVEYTSDGKRHLQGYLQLYAGHEATMRTVKKYLQYNWVHLEPSRGSSDENRDYCSKLQSAEEGTFVEHGTIFDCQGTRTDWHQINDMINAGASLNTIINTYPAKMPFINCIEKRIAVAQRAKLKNKEYEKPVVIVKTGTAGTKKTGACLYDDDGKPLQDVYQLEPGNTNDGELWFDGYNGEKTLLIDDFYGNIKYSYLLRLLEGHGGRLPVKGGFAYKNWNKVYITSNDHPSTWYSKGMTKALRRRIHKFEHYKFDPDDSGQIIKIDYTHLVKIDKCKQKKEWDPEIPGSWETSDVIQGIDGDISIPLN